MALVNWRLKGVEVGTCSCAYGCPCQFDALPTHGDCRGFMGARIDVGHFGDVPLSGLRFVGLFAWPGPIHEGNGEGQWIVDARADSRQRDALLTVLSGEETESGATIFNIFAVVIPKRHPPIQAEIELTADIEARTARVRIDGLVDVALEPIRNPVTGEAHRARIVLPQGFEYHEAEIASGTARIGGTINHDWSGRHAQLSVLHMTQNGVVH
jgi:hypothetical protein